MSLLARLRPRRTATHDEVDDGDEDRCDATFQSALTRRAIVAALWAAIALSLPLWWTTTTIVRLPLPEAELSKWADRGACPVRIPVELRVDLPDQSLPQAFPYHDDHAVPSILYHARSDFLSRLRDDLIRELDTASGRTLATDSRTDEDALAASDDSCIEWHIRFPNQEDGQQTYEHQPFGYNVVLAPNASRGAGADDIVLNRTMLEAAPTSAPALATAMTSQLRAIFRLPLRTLPGADTRAIQYSRPLRLVFSLLNEDATRGGAADGWNLDEALRDSELQTLIDSLAGVHDVDVESQVLWYAPLAFQPTKEETTRVLEHCNEPEAAQTPQSDGQDSTELDGELDVDTVLPDYKTQSCTEHNQTDTKYVVEWEDLKVFVNAAAWSLTSAASSLRAVASVPLMGLAVNSTTSVPALVEEEERTIHLLLYIPAADRRPLLVRDPVSGNASSAHAWMVPQWGGVVLYNSELDADRTASPKGEVGPALQAEDLQDAVRLWTSQLRTLLGLRSESAPLPSCSAVNPSDSSCVPRRLPSDLLAIRRIVESARDAVATLQSTVRLVHKISNLGVGDEVKGDVQGALELLAKLDADIGTSSKALPSVTGQAISSSQAHPDLQHALALASLSSTLASRAFFHPSMLGLLYFPEEHKYAVYTPLFGPVAVPLLVALIRELKSWRKARRRKRKAQGEAKEKAQ